MEYEVTAINEGSVTVKYKDGSWAEVPLLEDMTTDQVDSVIRSFGPKTHKVPSFIAVGYVSYTPPTPDPIFLDGKVPDLSSPDTSMAWFEKRTDAYGTVAAQIEFITEQGLEAWQKYVKEVKTTYPKV